MVRHSERQKKILNTSTRTYSILNLGLRVSLLFFPSFSFSLHGKGRRKTQERGCSLGKTRYDLGHFKKTMKDTPPSDVNVGFLNVFNRPKMY